MNQQPSAINIPRTVNTLYESTESWATVETPALFKDDVTLLPHQTTVVKSMLDLEQQRYVEVGCEKYTKHTGAPVKIQSTAMVLSESFGSGKTVVILALIAIRPYPRAVAELVNSPMIVQQKQHHYGRYARNEAPVFKHEIVRKFIGPTALLKPNLIIVGASVMKQWADEIQRFTNLTVFEVGDFHKLKALQMRYESGLINQYNIILLKNGKVTGNFQLPGETGGSSEYRSMISVVRTMTAQSCWSRVIYDDFDTIDIPSGSQAINALFTVYVSATLRADKGGRIVRKTYKNVQEAINSRGIPLAQVHTDKSLFTDFNLRNTASYVERSTQIPIVNCFKYVYSNPDDNYIRLLGVMGEKDAENIMEMLNGDAIGTAAEQLGIKTNSVADIFKKMLDKKYEKYLHDNKVFLIVEEILGSLAEVEEREDGKQHSMKALNTIRAAIEKENVPTIKYFSDKLQDMLDNMLNEYAELSAQDGLAISRVVDNVKEGQCQICRFSLKDRSTFIVKCCGLIVCEACGIKGNNIRRRYDYRLKGETISGACANCKSPVYPQKDLIFIDSQSFNINDLLTATGDEKPEEPEPKPVVVDETKPAEPEIKNPKLKALLAIATAKIPENCEEIKVNIKHLIQGRNDLPPKPNQVRKVLVFANYSETLKNVEDFLCEQNILFLRLGGTFREMANTVKQFQTGECTVLLINSQHNCAGLNMQFATDLVFMHKIVDINIESQVAGRIQRIGRDCNARIHYLCYKNEKDMC